MGPDRLVQSKLFIFLESPLTMPILLILYSNDRHVRQKNDGDDCTYVGIMIERIVGSPAESHRQVGNIGGPRKRSGGGATNQCTLQAACAAHGLKAIGYRYHAGRRIPRKRRARTGWQRMEWNRETLNGRDLHLRCNF